MTLRARLRAAVAPPVDDVSRHDTDTERNLLYRRVVVSLTLVAGTWLLTTSLSQPPGDSAFYLFSATAAATWTIGGVLSGPLHLARLPLHSALRQFLLPSLATGLLTAAVFILGALAIREASALRGYIDRVLDHARHGSPELVALMTIANGVAEEIFFRGGLFAAIDRRYPVAISTLAYALSTGATGNPMLAFAALALGLVVGLERRASGGILAPIITHITWSVVLLLTLPPLFAVH